MEITTTKKDGLSGSSVIAPNSTFTLLEVTVPLVVPHTKESEAEHLVYTELLLAGCGSYSKDAFTDALSLLGSSIHVSSNNQKIHFSLRSRTENLLKTLNILALMIREPLFSSTELLRIKKKLMSALVLAKEDAQGRAQDAFVNTVVRKEDRRYSYDIDTTISEVEKVTLARIKTLHNAVLKSAWIYTAGGSEQACTQVLKILNRLKQDNKDVAAPASMGTTVIPVTKNTLSLIHIPHKQNIEFTIGNALPLTRASSDYTALYFAMAVLAIPGGFAGRLMSTVREEEGLTYKIYGQLESISQHEMGYFTISTFFSPKDAVRGITSTMREITTLFKKGITDDELRRFKAILKTRFSMVEDSLIKKVREVHGYTNADLTKEQFEAFQADIQNMTAEKVNAAIQKYLNPKALVMSGAGPIQSVKKELEVFGK